jgi:hypothetical protein
MEVPNNKVHDFIDAIAWNNILLGWTVEHFGDDIGFEQLENFVKVMEINDKLLRLEWMIG